MNLKIFIALIIGGAFVITTAKAAQTQVFLQIINTGSVQTGFAEPTQGGGGQGYAGGYEPGIITTGFGSPTVTGGVIPTTGGTPIITGKVAGAFTTGDLELYSGYKWAFEQGITFRTGFNERALYGVPTRADLAKMISVFAHNTLGRPIIPVQACDVSMYKDYPTMTGNESLYIKQACDLGLMGRQNDKLNILEYFKPNELVNRAMVATVLSRLLYGNQYNGNMAENWYKEHLEALHKAGYIRKIDQPFAYERYGYLMLIMQRIAEDKL